MEYNIAWELFTIEEVAALKKACQMGLRNYLVQCVIEMTPQKEVEIQKLANQLEPVAIEDESDVLKQFTIEKIQQIKRGEATSTSPESPEEEARLQKMLDEEQLEKQKKFSEKTKEKVAELKQEIVQEAKIEKQEDDVKSTEEQTEETKKKPGRPSTKWKLVNK